MFSALIRKLSSITQSSDTSFLQHNSQYEEPGKLEKDKELGRVNMETDEINGPEHKTLDLLKKHPGVDTVVDIGSGAGWVSAELSKYVTRVFAIEPSAAGVDISRKSYPGEKYPNITWIVGFGEKELTKLNLNTPTLFVTGCVLNHLRDQEVSAICRIVTEKAPTGSILSFVENWSNKEWHQRMWHVRTKEWWQEQLPGWELDFHGPEVPEKDEYKGRYHKGIHGVKVA